MNECMYDSRGGRKARSGFREICKSFKYFEGRMSFPNAGRMRSAAYRIEVYDWMEMSGSD